MNLDTKPDVWEIQGGSGKGWERGLVCSKYNVWNSQNFSEIKKYILRYDLFQVIPNKLLPSLIRNIWIREKWLERFLWFIWEFLVSLNLTQQALNNLLSISGHRHLSQWLFIFFLLNAIRYTFHKCANAQ